MQAHKRKIFVPFGGKMAKKGLFVLVIAAFAAGEVWAQVEFSVSAGAGGLISNDFGGGINASQGGISVTYETPYFGGGGYAFLDATYAELTVAFFAGSGTYKRSTTSGGITASTDYDTAITNLNICLLLKHPFEINDVFSFFPLLGVDYSLCLSAKIDGDDIEDRPDLLLDGKAGDFSALWFKFGAGWDFAFTDRIYLRIESLCGIRLANKAETYWKNNYKKGYPGIDVETLLGYGMTAKLALGFKFF
jgi:hypothetical protein